MPSPARIKWWIKTLGATRKRERSNLAEVSVLACTQEGRAFLRVHQLRQLCIQRVQINASWRAAVALPPVVRPVNEAKLRYGCSAKSRSRGNLKCSRPAVFLQSENHPQSLSCLPTSVTNIIYKQNNHHAEYVPPVRRKRKQASSAPSGASSISKAGLPFDNSLARSWQTPKHTVALASKKCIFSKTA